MNFIERMICALKHTVHNKGLRKEKWIFMCIYRPPKQNNQYFLENLSSTADHYSNIYDNYMFLGDFHMEPNCSAMTSFIQSFNLFNLIKTNT